MTTAQARGGAARAVNSRIENYRNPVSYTHLDVYKRQVYDNVAVPFRLKLWRDRVPAAERDGLVMHMLESCL